MHPLYTQYGHGTFQSQGFTAPSHDRSRHHQVGNFNLYFLKQANLEDQDGFSSGSSFSAMKYDYYGTMPKK